MDRIYQVEQGRQRFYAVERDGQFRQAALRGGTLFEGYDLGAPMPEGLKGLRVVAPVRPSKIVCVGLNYKDHAAEVKKPLPAEPLLQREPSPLPVRSLHC